MNKQMSLVECEDMAKDQGFNTATFDVVGPGGRLKAKWLDAYMGMFQVEGHTGFLMTSEAKDSFRNMNLHCENFQANPEVTQ